MSDSSAYHAPPRVAEWLLARMFPDQGSYTTLGDLAEVYNHLASAYGARRANAWYWMQWARSLGPFFVNILYWGGIMFRNYLIIALRNLRRQKVYTLINVFGLALAIACAVLIYSFVRSEMTYDTFHAGYEKIYRVTSVVHFRDMEQWDSTPFPLATVIEEQAPGLEAVARLVSIPDKILHIDEQVIHAPLHLAGPALFELFDFPLERGDPTVILEEPGGVIIRPYSKNITPGETPSAGGCRSTFETTLLPTLRSGAWRRRSRRTRASSSISCSPNNSTKTSSASGR